MGYYEMLLARRLNGGAGYTLPPATADTLGGVKIGDNINVTSDGTISTTVDTTLNSTSNNAIANSTVYNALAGIEGDIEDINTDLASSKTTAKADIVSISDAQDIPAEEVKADIEPIQDLHGYEYPWVGGAGKNLLPMTVEGIKSANTTGTWSGNTYTISSCDFTVLTDNSNNVTGIKINNAPSDNHANFYLSNEITLNENCTLSGGVASATVKLRVYSGQTVAAEDAGQGASITAGTYTNTRIIVNENYNPNNMIVYPMIRLSTVTDGTFAPYSNICPISGYTECEVTRAGKNLFDIESWLTSKGVTYTKSGNSYTFTANYLVGSSNYLKFSDTPISVTLSASVVNGTATHVGLRLKNTVNNEVSTKGTYITMVANAVYIDWSTSGTVTITEPQIEQGTTATNFAPYQGQTYTVEFVDSQDNPMTVYSGTLDVTTGVLTVDRAMAIFDGSEDEDWNKYASGSASAFAMYISKGDINGDIVCNYLQIISENATWDNYDSWISVTGNIIVTGIKSITTVADWKTYLSNNNLQVLYKLATPQTYNLTPIQIDMLLNNNVISASTGKIQVKYQPANVIGELKKLIYQLTT